MILEVLGLFALVVLMRFVVPLEVPVVVVLGVVPSLAVVPPELQHQ